MVAGIAAAADFLLAVIFLGKDNQGRLDNTTTKTENQMEGRLLLDVLKYCKRFAFPQKRRRKKVKRMKSVDEKETRIEGEYIRSQKEYVHLRVAFQRR